jgi:hypothetical protein
MIQKKNKKNKLYKCLSSIENKVKEGVWGRMVGRAK